MVYREAVQYMHRESLIPCVVVSHFFGCTYHSNVFGMHWVSSSVWLECYLLIIDGVLTL
jgi:hypothetical protein